MTPLCSSRVILAAMLGPDMPTARPSSAYDARPSAHSASMRLWSTVSMPRLARASIRELHREAAIASNARRLTGTRGRLRRLVTSRRVGG